MLYDDALRRYRDTMSVMEEAKEEGRKEGREEAMISVARNMKASGMSAEEIEKMTGLPKDKIADL